MRDRYEEHFFTRERVDYYCIRYPGERQTHRPVVLIHGLMMGPRFWFHEEVEKLRQNGDVYCISLAGHYPSTLPDDFSGPITEAFITQMIDHQLAFFGLENEKVILVGHSTGALAALVYALSKPEAIAALGILSTLPYGRETSGMYRLFQDLNRRYGRIGYFLWYLTVKTNSFSYPLHRALLGDVAYDRKKLFSYPGLEQWIAWYFEHNAHLNARNTGIWLRSLYDIDVRDRLDQITAPVLLLYSGNDPYVETTAMTEIENRLVNAPQIDTKLIEKSGHLPMYESSAEFQATFIPWLGKVSEQSFD